MTANRIERAHLKRLAPMLAAIFGTLLSVSVVFAGLPAHDPLGAQPPDKETAPTPRPAVPQASAPANRPALASARKQVAANPQVVLHDQYDIPGANGVSSQNFEPSRNAYDAQAADDFVVPAGQSWSLESIEVAGTYANGPGPADSVNIYIYSNAGTLPATPVFTRTHIPYNQGPGYGDLVVPLDPPATLPSGIYWLSVQANQNYDPHGQWYWTNRDIGRYSSAAWRNPGGGFGIFNCTNNWGSRAYACGLIGPFFGDYEPDQMFRLSGAVNATPSPTLTGTPPTATHTRTGVPTTTGTRRIPSPVATPPFPIPTAPICGPGSDYIYTESTGASIVPGTMLVPGSQCNDCTAFVSLPFPYSLYGQSFSYASVTDNGALMFGTSSIQSYNECLPTYWIGYYTIFPHWDELDTSISITPTLGVYTSISGSAPNRIFNVEWRACLYNFGSCGGYVNFEVRLYEGQERFDILYGTVTSSGGGATVGVQKLPNSLYTQYSCNTSTLSQGLQLSFTHPPCDTPTATPTGTPPTSTATPTPTNSPTRTPTLTRTPTPGTCGPNSNYTISSSTGAAIEPGTSLVPNSQCDQCATHILLPFAYSLYGQEFNSALLGDNGTLGFLTNGNSPYSYCLPASSWENFDHAILPHWDDLVTNCTGCGIYTSVSGSAPNRIFNIEWRADLLFGGYVNFEVRLYEGQERFDIVYGTVGGSGGSATIGVQKNSFGLYTQYSCHQGTLSQGLQLTFTHPVCPSPTATVTGTPPTATPTPCGTGYWTAQGPYPAAILDEAVVQQGGSIYSFGGYDGISPITAAYVYDPSTDSWDSIASLPEPRAGHRAVSDGTYIYILGGFDAFFNYTSTLWRYNPSTNSYSTLAPYTIGTAGHAAAYLDGKIYRIAGQNEFDRSGTSDKGNRSRQDSKRGVYGSRHNSLRPATNSVEVYTISTNSWSTAASYPLSATWPMAIPYGGFIFAGGGYEDVLKTYRYDPSTDSWDDDAIEDLPEPRYAAASGVYGARWLLAGGFVNSNVTDTAIAWEPTNNTWYEVAPMLEGRAYVGGAATAQGLYAVGGYTPDFNVSSDNQRFVETSCGTHTPTATGTLPTGTATRTRTPTRTPTPTATSTPTPDVCGPNSNYVIGQSTGVSIVPGTTLVTGSQCDDCVVTIALPFTYGFYNQQFSTAYVSDNGTLTFTPAFTPYFNSCLPYVPFNHAIAAHWDDLRTDTGPGCSSYPTGCGVYTSVSGSAPNRIFNIEWRTIFYLSTSELANFEVRLYEGQNRFDIIYGQIDGSGNSATVGVQRDTGSLYTQYTCDLGGLSQGLQLEFGQPPCGTPSTATRTRTATPTLTRTVTVTPSNTPPNIPTDTPTNTPTNTPTDTPTNTPTNTGVATETATVMPCVITFTDVHLGDYFYEPVRYLYCRGVISGYSDNTFRPYNNTTRGQLTKIVVLAFGFPIYTPPTPTFTDVPENHTFYQYIEIAAHEGLVSGYSDGTFRPQNDVTRGQLSKIVVEAAAWPLLDPPVPTFSDVPRGSAFFQYIETAYDQEIITGYADGTFRPANNATRGQICKIVYNAITRP